MVKNSEEKLVVNIEVEIVHDNPEMLTRSQLNILHDRLEKAAVASFKEASGFMEGWFKVYVRKPTQQILDKEYCVE